MFQECGLLRLPTLAMDARGDLVPPVPAVAEPEVLKSDQQPVARSAPAEAEAAPPPTARSCATSSKGGG